MVKILRNIISNIDVVTKLEKVGITTARDLLEANKILLLCLLDLPLKDIDIIIDDVSKSYEPVNVLHCEDIYEDYIKSQNFMSSSIKLLDDALRGGLPVGCITEITGSPGAGKTQFCFGVCVQAIVDHWKNNAFSAIKTVDGNAPMYSAGGGVIYYDTENKFNAERFKQIAIKKFPELFDTQLSNDAIHRLETLFSKIEIRKVLTSEELNDDIASKETQDFIVERGIKLIVVDSIAYLLRHESFDEKSREMKLIAPAANLKAIADKVGLVVLVTNQITQVESDCFDNNDKFGDTFQQSTTTFRPYLGPTWSHCTSCRIVMRCDADNFQLPDVRFIEIAKSPLAPKSTLNYKITDTGISCDLV
jgi:RAD51-like protein 1